MIKVQGVLRTPQGTPIQGAELVLTQTRTSLEVLAGTGFSSTTSPTGSYLFDLGEGTYSLKLRQEADTTFSTVASNILVLSIMDGYSLNAILADQDELQDVNIDILTQVLGARDTAVQAQAQAQQSEQKAKTSETAAKTSETAAKASQAQAKSSEDAARASQTAAQSSQTTATTKASEAQASASTATTKAQESLTSQNAAKASQTQAKASEDAAKLSQNQAKVSEDAAKASQVQAKASENIVGANQAQAKASELAAKASQDAARSSENIATTKASEAASSASSALASKNAAATSEANALASKNAAASSATSASGSATTATTKAAEAAASAVSAATAVADAALPFPDVWIPFNDSLRMLAGYGDDIKVGDYTVATQASFSRASTATYIDKSGVLRTAAINEPRFEKEGLLIEGQSTNLFNKSAASGYDWTSEVLSQSAGSAQLPFDVFQKTITSSNSAQGSSEHAIVDLYHTSNPAALAGGPVTVSAYMFGDADAIVSASPRLNISAGLPITGISTSVIKINSNTVRIIWSGVIAPGSSSTFHNLQVRWMNRLQSVVIGCYQIEALPFATSYIPTNGAAATRAGDVVKIPWALNVPTYNLTVSAQYELRAGAAQRLIEYGHDATPRYLVQVDQNLYMQSYCGTSPVQFSAASTSGLFAVATSRAAHRFYVSGLGFVSSVPLGGVVQTTHVRIGDGIRGSIPMFGHIRNFRIWHSALTDAQIKGLK